MWPTFALPKIFNLGPTLTQPSPEHTFEKSMALPSITFVLLGAKTFVWPCAAHTLRQHRFSVTQQITTHTMPPAVPTPDCHQMHRRLCSSGIHYVPFWKTKSIKYRTWMSYSLLKYYLRLLVFFLRVSKSTRNRNSYGNHAHRYGLPLIGMLLHTTLQSLSYILGCENLLIELDG